MTERHTVSKILDDMDACGPACKWSVAYEADYSRAWAECPWSDWMIWIACRLGVDQRLIVRTLCECVRVGFTHGTNKQSMATVNAADAWAEGIASAEYVKATNEISGTMPTGVIEIPTDIDGAASYLARAVSAETDFSFLTHANNTIIDACCAIDGVHAFDDNRDGINKKFCDLIRQRIPYTVVEDAISRYIDRYQTLHSKVSS